MNVVFASLARIYRLDLYRVVQTETGGKSQGSGE